MTVINLFKAAVLTQASNFRNEWLPLVELGFVLFLIFVCSTAKPGARLELPNLFREWVGQVCLSSVRRSSM